MSRNIHRLPLGDTFHFGALAGQGPDRLCDDCGARAEVGLEYYSDGKYIPGEDLCWDCSSAYGPFTTDRAAERRGEEPYVISVKATTANTEDMDNPALAESLRRLGREASGDSWLAARLLRRQGSPVESGALDRAERCVRRVKSQVPSDLSHASLEEAIDEAWQQSSLPDSDDAKAEVTDDSTKRSYWMHVWRYGVWSALEEIEPGDLLHAVASRTGRAGDLAALYVGQPISGIVAILHLTSDAGPADTDLADDAAHFRFMAEQEVVAILNEPLSVQDMRETPELADLSAVRQNFRSSVIEVAPARWDSLIAQLEVQLPSIRRTLAGVEPPPDVQEFASERELEDYLVANLDRFSHIFGLELRLADEAVDGLRGRQPVLQALDTKPDLVLVSDDQDLWVVVELKNTSARPGHVGQLASYVTWIRQHYANGSRVVGMLVTARDTPACRAARTLTPAIEHFEIGEVLGGSHSLGTLNRGQWDELASDMKKIADAALSVATYIDSAPVGAEGEDPAVRSALDYYFDLTEQSEQRGG